MKVQNFSVYNKVSIQKTKTDYHSRPFEITASNKKAVNFGAGLQTAFEISKKLKRELALEKSLLSLINRAGDARFYNMKRLEGIQKGIEVFDGLNLKQIRFSGEDLHSILGKRGCYSKCLHCYPGAKKPYKEFSSILFEDYKAVIEGYKTLEQRTGIKFLTNNRKQPCMSLVFDSDNIDIAVTDLKGKVHEFPELNKMIFDSLSIQGLFDTSGWNVKSIRLQQRAERIVKYYSSPENMKEIKQFNISINPFHSILTKSNELREKGYIKAADDLYHRYIERMSNALLTCKPLMESENFHTIIRAFKNEMPNMEGYNETAAKKIVKDIKENIFSKCRSDLKTNKQYVKNIRELIEFMKALNKKLSKIETEMILSPPVEKLLKARNPEISDFQIRCSVPTFVDSYMNFNVLENEKRVSHLPIKYSKLVDIDGRVYLTDNYKVIPTDIQFNFINKHKSSEPMSYMVDDFVVTKDML